MIGARFAVYIALRHVFWSIHGKITYFACGFYLWRVRSEKVRAIPVADGIIINYFANLL